MFNIVFYFSPFHQALYLWKSKTFNLECKPLKKNSKQWVRKLKALIFHNVSIYNSILLLTNSHLLGDKIWRFLIQLLKHPASLSSERIQAIASFDQRLRENIGERSQDMYIKNIILFHGISSNEKTNYLSIHVSTATAYALPL